MYRDWQSHSHSDAMWRYLWFLGISAFIVILLNTCAPPPSPQPTPPSPPPTDIIDFESLPPGQSYHWMDTFSNKGVEIEVLRFYWTGASPLNPTPPPYAGGFAYVDYSGHAGRSGNEMHTNNANLGFKFDEPLIGLTVHFGEYGGNLNIRINDEFKNFENFADINTATIGGVNVSVVNGHGNDTGILELSGSIDKFTWDDPRYPRLGIYLVIGGQELWIDDVDPHK